MLDSQRREGDVKRVLRQESLCHRLLDVGEFGIAHEAVERALAEAVIERGEGDIADLVAIETGSLIHGNSLCVGRAETRQIKCCSGNESTGADQSRAAREICVLHVAVLPGIAGRLAAARRHSTVRDSRQVKFP